MSIPLIIGIGNPTRGDDGAGPRVVERLRQERPEGRYHVVQQLTPELAEELASAEVVVFVDASVRVDELTITEVDRVHPAGTSHAAWPGALLRLTERVYGRRPHDAVQVEIPAIELGFREALSPPTQHGVEQATELLRDWLDAWIVDHEGEPAGGD